MALRDISPAKQEQILRLRQLEQTVQNLRIQLGEISRALSEIEMTNKELQKLNSETEVWKSVGSVMFPKKVGEVLKELADRAELLELKQKSFTSQETQNVKRLEELQARLSKQLGDS
ncbi:MAG: prefoldin subunit beta, partial [Candidatus Hodarchaeales archaeon]